MIELPYPGDYPELRDYMKAVRPVRKWWDWLCGEWKSPAALWRWHWENLE